MFKKILSLGLLLWFSCSVMAATIDTIKVYSPSMKTDVNVLVIAPDGAHRAGAHYPVLYLLHGHSGNEYSWIGVQPKLPQMAERDGVIVVCPDGKNSWYWDSPVNPKMRYETFVAKELIDYIDAHYATLADRSGRAITGLSMGGHGALWLAIRHQDRFGAGGSTSGGVDIRPFPKNWNMEDALGPRDQNPARWDAYTVINLVDTLQNGSLALVVDCGYQDFFFEVNNSLHQKLLARHIDHDFLVRPGVHNAPYWNNSLDYQWLFFRKFFDRATAAH